MQDDERETERRELRVRWEHRRRVERHGRLDRHRWPLDRGLSPTTRWRRRQEEKWTPTVVGERCCLDWLVKGRCENQACTRDHPRIHLTYTQGTGTVAVLTHELNPFLNYFHQGIREGIITKLDSSRYALKGYIREEQKIMRRFREFGCHVITIKKEDLDASDAAHLEAYEQAQRPRKLLKSEDPCDPHLMESALEVCRLHWLTEELNAVDIAFMRTANRTFGRVAARMCTHKLRTLELSCLVFVDGKTRFGRDIPETSSVVYHGHGESDTRRDEFGREGPRAAVYNKVTNEIVPFLSLESESPAVFESNNQVECSYDSGWLENADKPESDDNNYLFDYEGHMVRLFMKPKGEYRYKLAEFFFSPTNCARLDGPRSTMSNYYGAVLHYEIVNGQKNIEKLEVPSEGADGEATPSGVETRAQTRHQYTGSIRIRNIHFGYSSLLEYYLAKELSSLGWKHREIQETRPLTTHESKYYCALYELLHACRGARRAW